MSSLTRRIQKNGTKMGVRNPQAKDLLARTARKEKRNA